MEPMAKNFDLKSIMPGPTALVIDKTLLRDCWTGFPCGLVDIDKKIRPLVDQDHIRVRVHEFDTRAAVDAYVSDLYGVCDNEGAKNYARRLGLCCCVRVWYRTCKHKKYALQARA